MKVKKELTIDMVPSSLWYINLRSMLSIGDWDKLRREAYKQSGYKCEICEGRGDKHPVECHEYWEYDDKEKIQKLVDLIALCPACHEVKHFGLANIRGRTEAALKHLAKVNDWDEEKTRGYTHKQIEIYHKRDKFEWSIDLSWLDKNGVEYRLPQPMDKYIGGAK